MEHPPGRWRRAPAGTAAWCAVAVSALAVAAATPLAVVNWRELGPESVWTVNGLIAVLVPPAGAFLLGRRPRHRIGLVLVSASGLGVSFLGLCWADYGLRSRPGALPGGDWAALVAGMTWVPFLALVTLLPLWFPDGRPAGRFWTVVERWVLALLVAVPLLALAETRVAAGLADNPLWAGVAWATPALDAVILALVGSAAVLCLPAAVLRYVRGGTDDRIRQRWFLLCTALVVASLFQPGPPLSDLITGLALGLTALAITVAVLRHRLWGIDAAVHRTLVYAALTVTLLLLFLIVVGLADRVLPEGAALLGAAAVAVVCAPLQSRLRGMARTLLYGDRDDPYSALTRLATRLEANLVPEDVPAVALAEVLTALRVPHATLLADGRVLAEAGRAPGDGRTEETVPLVHQGVTVGTLRVATRRPGEALSVRDRSLLADLARPLAGTVHGTTLRAELRRSREDLVEALERERRRLRRDLHDGVGPTLAALVLELDAVAHAARGPDPATVVTGHVDAMKVEVRELMAELRRIVEALRPPALDELGLAGALDRHLATVRHPGTGPDIRMRCGLDGVALPAAVEVAAYRIVAEAVTNVLRHAGARTCEVRLAMEPAALSVEVEDDGTGGAVPGAGTGLVSMRERARALGGAVQVGPAVPTGTLVRATLPVRRG